MNYVNLVKTLILVNGTTSSSRSSHSMTNTTTAVNTIDDNPIIEFIGNFLVKSLRIKPDKWLKLLTTEEYKNILLEWTTNVDKIILIISVLPNGILIPILGFPTPCKGKSCYFIKKYPIQLQIDNLKDNVLYGDISSNSIESLSLLVDDIFVPLLSNPKNQQLWPELIKKDVESHLNELKNIVSEIKGSLNNKTILAIPLNINEILSVGDEIENGNKIDCNLVMKNTLEGMVIKWCHQINEVLQYKPDNELKYPVPSAEYRYWNMRYSNLENIYNQLTNKSIKSVVSILQSINSVYYDSFKMIFHDTVKALNESRDIAIYLNALAPLTEQFQGIDFQKTKSYIRPLLHCICLMWANSIYYCTVEHWTRLFRMISNLLIRESHKSLDSCSIFQSDVDEKLCRLGETIEILDFFKEQLILSKSKLRTYIKPGTHPIPWSFKIDKIFKRLNIYVNRLNDIKAILETANEFSKLERIEFGGLKGKHLGRRISDVSVDFQKLYNKWSFIDFDPLDIEMLASVQFQEIKKVFEHNADSLERTLAQIFVEAFDDCYTTEHGIKLVEIAGTLFERNIIKNQIKDKYKLIVGFYIEEVQRVDGLFENGYAGYKQHGLQGIHCDAPTVDGVIKWMYKLRKCLTGPLKDLPYLDYPIFENEFGAKVFAERDVVLKKILKFETEILEQWNNSVSLSIPKNMAQSLISRLDNNLLKLNFNDDLTSALKETTILKSLNYVCPTIADEIHLKNDNLWDIRIMISRIVEWYNFIQEKLEICEKNIISNQLMKIDENLQESIVKYTWVAYDETYIKSLYEDIKQLFNRITIIQRNIKNIEQSIEEWGRFPLYERKDRNQDMLLNIDDIQIQMNIRIENICKTKELILYALEENYRLFFNLNVENSHCNLQITQKPDKTQYAYRQRRLDQLIGFGKSMDYLSVSKVEIKKPSVQSSQSLFNLKKLIDIVKNPMDMVRFIPYQEYVDKTVANAIIDSIHLSMSYIKNEMESDKAPLFEIKMKLQGNNILLTPAIDDRMSNESLIVVMQNIFENIFKTIEHIPRICKTTKLNDETYKSQLMENEDIINIRNELLQKVISTTDKLKNYLGFFKQYEFVWMEDKETCLEEFLKHGRILTKCERNKCTNDDSLMESSRPNLNMFKDQIEKWQQLYDEIDKIEAFKTFDSWLKLDLSSFKQSLLNECCKWTYLYKKCLVNYLTITLKDFNDFIAEGMKILLTNVDLEDFTTLLSVMSILNQIKEKNVKVDRMFEPLKDILNTLRYYNVDVDDGIAIYFSELPEKWHVMKKISLEIQDKIEPIRLHQVDMIIKRIAFFDKKLNVFRNEFIQMEFFQVPCKDPYRLCNEIHQELFLLEYQLENLKDSASLFKLNQPSTTKLVACRKEIKLIKQIWDFINVVESSVEYWKKTAWKKLDVEEMEQQCKQFNKDVRSLGKTVRLWKPFLYVEQLLKNLVTSLRAITELQNLAIRDRHWIELMQCTGLFSKFGREYLIKIRMNKLTTLRELLNLNLHEFEDDVKITVDKAVKEMAMEKILNDINAIWENLEFQYDLHERSGLQLLKVSEELIETLEENQVQVQNMKNSKYISYFEKEFNEWTIKLSNADLIINIWSEIQRKWIYLESIFIRSEDIRLQLPDDSKRFDSIDEEFRVILKDMTIKKNVIIITNQLNLYKSMENILFGLVLCEKALNEYLETKRLAYPRFYFISCIDLLDILSNGNDPIAVGRHLIKLYDSIMSLRYYQKENKIADGMYAKENDEFVEFVTQLDCGKKVEHWLNELTYIMRQTLHDLFNRAIKDYDGKARDLWVFDWPAQTALCITQIWWNFDVNEAFSKQQEGYENALKDYQKKQIVQLNSLILLLLGDLSVGDRQKIMTICTIDVHSRDVVAKMINQRIENANSFQWQSQLRHRWDWVEKECYANICDAQFKYDYEYLGNTPRLVITPLTDRCYITLTQSLHLIMGGAPAGPAGTGKTETTKDLGKGLGIMVYVFNCSEQMDYRSCGNIYKGLAQTGAWGCFDEFNRISIEVLSVVAVQVKCIQDAIKTQKTEFVFMGETIALKPTVGLFVTMNPGYAGRTELPENLKALFRPCAMVVPDFALICEIMLVAEGFQNARVLARKFITLYILCKELLSQQDHYDWGLRAIKSVLVVAGALRRGDRQRPEDQVLMRALRDFNIPKIVTDDAPIFLGLIGDLFPLLDVPRKRLPDFEKIIKKSALDLRLQPEEGFVLKIVQLEELLAVRHSVFIVGNAGTGKSEIWKTLYKTYCNQKLKPHYNDLNPKGVTNDELFGIINPATREWKDGLFSVIMRDQANLKTDGPKWIVLDGDIDPMWIESLNTVMDDNKVLTLASNERIALTKEMRLLFEIDHLRSATPATVSRAGILYINTADLGWYPYVASWIEARENLNERSTLTFLFDKYMPIVLEATNKFKKVTPISDIAMIQMTCHLLDCLLCAENVPIDCPKDWYEIYFTFAIIWGFGSTLSQDQQFDWRNEFNRFWHQEFKTVRFPGDGNIFNFYVDATTKQFQPWTNLVLKFELDSDVPLQTIMVPTVETVRLRWFLDLLISRKHPVMLVGGAGLGKTVMLNEKLSTLSSEDFVVTNIPFNFYTTSEMLQKILEKPLEKKAGRNYAPTGNKQMIYFLDDMNMPEVDAFGTVQPHQIIRQFMDYSHWYDRSKLTLREIHNCQMVACMNPTAGSFTIDPRLQRHFCSFSVCCPSNESLYLIYNSILSQHLSTGYKRFSSQYLKIVSPLVTMGLHLHNRMSQTFLPTAIKFHYTFNLRDLANIYQGLLFSTKDTCPEPEDLAKLYVHEANRVYGDKLVSEIDQENFKKIFRETFKKTMEDLDDQPIFKEPLVFCHFADGLGDPKYMPIKSWKILSKLLAEAQNGYNDIVGFINLVMFEDAMCHVCRINRIIEGPRGNALLIGVGGSGKQSLARLAAFISSLSVYQIQLRRNYSIVDLKNDLNSLYMKVGVKNIQSMFLITDAQVVDESFLVLINDMLASGEIPDLFSDEEIDTIVNSMKNEVKQFGVLDSMENCWKHFVGKVRRMLKIVLCFSPVGSTLRKRSRKFPALVNCTAINWFHEWPKSALESVSKQFLLELKVLPNDITESVSIFMAYVLGSVNEVSQLYLSNEHRFNYTTPKSFLELISLYVKLLTDKTNDTLQKIKRLENGLVKLAQCAEQVDCLKQVLAEQEIQLAAKNEAADKLIVVVGAENVIVQKEKKIASLEEQKVRAIEEDVSLKAKLCEEDLRQAEPALLAAQKALNTLNKNNLTELKSFGTPPQAVINVCAAVLILFSKHKLPKDRSWKACKNMMGAVDKFLNHLIRFDKEHIPPKTIAALQPYLKDPEFDPEKILAKSSAASGLCAWVINIHRFYNVYLIVGPKQKALKNAQSELKAAQEKLNYLNRKILTIEEKRFTIQSEFDAALSDKAKYQLEADQTTFTIDLAHRLVNGLGSEAIRWHQAVDRLRNQITKLPGDVLLISCFISYVGCFSRSYRIDLQEKYWIPYFKELKPEIPHTDKIDPLELLCDDAQIASWNNEGLPSDRMSTENAIILLNSVRWPLMIDPQLQGIKWIKQRFGPKLIVIRLTQKGYLDIIEKAITSGDTVLLENIDETIDSVLDPLLSRNLIKKGKILKIGDKEVDFNVNFKLILQTKLANPHFKPELQAQMTLINFTVTRDGLEDQLLAEVVKAERPDLEESKSNLTIQQNSFKIALKSLEDDVLMRLSSAGENVLDDPTLVVNLEKTKKTAAEIELKVSEAKLTSIKIDKAREHYRPAAERASILYFILNNLFKINRMYQFSLKAFIVVFQKAIADTPSSDQLKQRVQALVDSITFAVFLYTCRGLFEKDKLVFITQMVIQILVHRNEATQRELDFLLRFPPHIPAIVSPFEFLTNKLWGGIRMLSMIDGYFGFDKDIEQSTKRWKYLIEMESPEKEKLPGEWKNKSPFQKLCIFRTIRPDRMIYAASLFVEEIMGAKYVNSRMTSFSMSFRESSPTTPIFFILSPGVDPLSDVERQGKLMGFSTDYGNFNNVSLGQGQQSVADKAMEIASYKGHWVILQNIHLVEKWLPKLEKKMEHFSAGAHADYRLFISAEPAPSAENHIIPQGILESAIKITNESPTGMQANLHKALDNFTQDTLEMCTKEAEFKSILFALCYFHAVVAERRKFGPQGWNIVYPFNVGDLTISVYVLFNYLEANKGVPWEDLRYLFGEIMYGGHITDDWDRRLCRTYLDEFMQPELVDGDLMFCRGFNAPSNTDYMGYHQYITNMLPAESPSLYGMHLNSEIGFLTSLSDNLLSTIFELQPRNTESTNDGSVSREESVKQIIEEFQDKLPDKFIMADIMSRVEERSPFVVVVFQECERMNFLIGEMKRSLRELWLGLKGELSITADMEMLDTCLLHDKVPQYWAKLAYPSTMGLQLWFANLIMRQRELDQWTMDFSLPACIWLAGFFNPQSFLTAIMQTTARKNEWPLDKMCLVVDVTGKWKDDFGGPPKEGANVYGLFMEGARWDSVNNTMASLRLKELFPLLPVVHIKAVTQDKKDLKNMYECPVYRNRTRGDTYIWTFNLKSREKPSKWILGGVAILLQT